MPALTTLSPRQAMAGLPVRARPAQQPRRAAVTVASGDGLVKPTAAPSTSAPSTSAPASPPLPPPQASSAGSAVTVEFQRAQAKAMTAWFRDCKAAATAGTTSRFGWTPANEKLNGRWVMFGVGVGLLTEYATGVDMARQMGLMATYLGLSDSDAF